MSWWSCIEIRLPFSLWTWFSQYPVKIEKKVYSGKDKWLLKPAVFAISTVSNIKYGITEFDEIKWNGNRNIPLANPFCRMEMDWIKIALTRLTKQINKYLQTNKQTNQHEEHHSDKPVMYDRDGLDEDGADKVG